MGMPHRIQGLEEILDYLLGHEDVWQATASQIAEHFIDHHYQEFVDHAEVIKGTHNAS